MKSDFQIIVVDDDPQFIFLHNWSLKKLGFNVYPEHFQNGEKLVEFFKQKEDSQAKFLILLDIYMPIMDGWEVLEFLESKGSYDTIKVILVTSSVDKGDKIKAENYTSVIDFLEKPLAIDYLIGLKDKTLFS
jgi:CheY-like chemotaxis protein